jgi:hypothetical protein
MPDLAVHMREMLLGDWRPSNGSLHYGETASIWAIFLGREGKRKHSITLPRY